MTEHQKHWFQCLIFSVFSISLISSLANLKGRRKKTSFCHWKKPDRQRLIVPLAFEIEPASASFAISHQIPSRNAAGLKCKTHMTTGVPRKVVVWVFDAAVRPDAAYNQSWSSSSCESLEVPVTSMVQSSFLVFGRFLVFGQNGCQHWWNAHGREWRNRASASARLWPWQVKLDERVLDKSFWALARAAQIRLVFQRAQNFVFDSAASLSTLRLRLPVSPLAQAESASAGPGPLRRPVTESGRADG